jgi:hypothetical protein
MLLIAFVLSGVSGFLLSNLLRGECIIKLQHDNENLRARLEWYERRNERNAA